MYICKVVGKVVSTIRHDRMGVGSLMLVRRINSAGRPGPELLVATDTLGCGEGNVVMVTHGSGARFAQGAPDSPVDLAIVGIVDHFRLGDAPEKSKEGKKQTNK